MERKASYRIAVLGATGAVGRRMVETLERRNFPIESLKLLASERSAGQTIAFRGEQLPVERATADSFEGIDIALFSAGATTSQIFAPEAVKRGAVVVDNSSAYRMDPNVPLVVPEVNPHTLDDHQGIIANPNCSTIQLMVALHALREFGLEHVTISTYQAVSGMGQKAVDALREEVAAWQATGTIASTIFPLASQDAHYPQAFNVLPQCDIFLDNGYTKEEMKLVNESRKILELPDLKVSPTAVRVPVLYGHAESVAVRFATPVTPDIARARFAQAENLVVVDEPSAAKYPHPQMAEGTGDTFVGRIRQDLADPHTLLFFVVADNLLKGAAWNAVQIAEELVKRA
ncbi:aspartate-semialdehyde dehydrogenase [Alicyclobacillus acidoterrestris]|uniref:Aspartate-semialdehyde dehydrogenase n=1 Tax=Alicyclobacillus acidoterrestris (strain ATCC 49025 / DSM 3922 / CIP 106132 / NCIMB 13137 / GD3B) TaxID=1356854 RepID=T0BQB6_ALIAG|nr:aspartate-semialdehyde dehydrogenase [Alicyclobacillus acidoterrestris]EPZ46213.1 aspartate-semialdehyde dehydrogenase [Alicyclobacillus acidoterrestris ATCC 49025]UNO47154.1 aspartate-semialdehyde dehydrogenase [Alicyclobacillus acidoterrestris]